MQTSVVGNISPAFHRLLCALARRVNVAVWLNRALFPTAVALAVFVAIFVLAKLFLAKLVFWTPLLLIGVPFAWVYAHVKCRRADGYFTTDNIIETVDHLYRDDGSVIAAVQSPEIFLHNSSVLEDAIQDVTPRMPRIQIRYYANRFFPLLLAVGLAFALPVRKAPVQPQSQEILASITQPLDEKLKELEEIIPEKDAEEFKKELEELRQSDDGISTEKWEAVEEIEKRMEAAEAKAQQALNASAKALNKISEQMSTAGNVQGNSPEAMADANEMMKDLQDALKNEKNISSEMKKELQDMAGKMGEGASTEELRKRLQELQEKMGGKGDGQDGKDGNGKDGNGKDGKDGDGNPGKGAITRGRGDAELSFEEEKKLENAQYNPGELKNDFFTPGDLVDLGIMPIKPDPKPGEFSPGVVKQFQNQEGSQVSRTRISPSQKDVVAKYFSSPDQPQNP